MREKKLSLIVTFHTTTAAMAMEKYCHANQVPGRLIPVPREITAGCGMSWKAAPEDRTLVENAAVSAGIEPEGYHEVVV